VTQSALGDGREDVSRAGCKNDGEEGITSVCPLSGVADTLRFFVAPLFPWFVYEPSLITHLPLSLLLPELPTRSHFNICYLILLTSCRWVHITAFLSRSHYQPLYAAERVTLHLPVLRRAGIAQSVWRLTTGLHDRGVGVRFPLGARIFSSPCLLDRSWRPPTFLSNEYRGALSPGIKRLGREADHSPPTSAEVKKT
jgi:hypothetical protein